MSDVNLVFTVSSVTSAFTVDTTMVDITPNTTAINMFAGYAAYPPNGAVGNSQVLFNDAGLFGGVSEFTYDKNAETLNVTNFHSYGTSDLGLVGNIRISGGTVGQVLTSNGSGIVSWTDSAKGIDTQLQFNDNGLLSGIPNVTFDGSNLSLGDAANIKILGGDNGYVLQTDGSGNLTWTAQTGGGGGSGNPAGANTQVQYNNAGVFGADAGFTYNSVTNTLFSDNLTAASDIRTGVILTDSILHSNGDPWEFNPEPGGLNTQVQFNDSNAFNGSNSFTFNNSTNTLSVTNLITSNVSGNGSGLTSLTGAQVTGTVANATHAANATNSVNANNAITSTYAGTVTNPTQANITSVGTLTSLNVSGNATFTGPIIMQEGLEKVTTNATGASETINFDVLTQSIVLNTTAATANFTLNVRGNSSTSLNSIMSNNQSLTCTFINTVTTNGYFANVIQIDGFVVNVFWAGADPSYVPVIGTAKDVYSFNIIKTGSGTYTVLGSSGRFV